MAKDKKDTYWFKHDLYPLNDSKMMTMVGEFGATGYGLYWKIAEMLHYENGNKIELDRSNFYTIYKQMLIDDEQVQANDEQTLTNAEQMQANASIKHLKKFQIKLNVSDIKFFIERCIDVHKLFKSDGKYFWSDRVHKNIQEKNDLSAIRAAAALSRSGSK